MNTIYATHKTPMVVPFYGMGKKKKMNGKGLIDNIGKAAKFLKDTQLISNLTGLIPDGRAQAVSNIAKQIGLGKKPKAKKPRKQKGAGLFSDIGNGIGGATFGLGSGLGNAFHGLFGGKKRGKKMINM